MPTTLAGQQLYPHAKDSYLRQGGIVRAIQQKLDKLERCKS